MLRVQSFEQRANDTKNANEKYVNVIIVTNLIFNTNVLTL